MTIKTPLRLKIQQNLSAALAEITILNGYQMDMSPATVYRGRVLFGPNDPIPALAIIEPPIALDLDRVPFDLPKAKGKYEILIQGFLPDDQRNPTDPAHILMADVKRRLAIEKTRKLKGFDRLNAFGLGQDVNGKNFISGIEIGAGVVRPPGEGVSDKAYFWLPLVLDIVEDLNDPFV